ncbi:MAG: glycosyltransferase family 4 protein [Actinomycetota bacterium]|nr:glycosyltransferase family 4 protein [Actinomycetota bacterium]
MIPERPIRVAKEDESSPGYKLLTLEANYSLRTVLARGLDREITCRDVDGLFDHVWSVNPIIGASPEHWGEQSIGPPSTMRLTERHTVVEGRIGRFVSLRRLPWLNFVVAQFLLLIRLLWLIRKERISMIRAGDPYYLGLFGMLLAASHRLPFVVRVNANQDIIYETTGMPAYPRLLRYRWLEKRIERFVLSRADLVAGGNQNNLNFALANGARPEHSTVFRCGTWMDPVHFEVEPEMRCRLDLGFRPGQPFLIIVGRLAPVKRPQDVIEVLRIAREKEPTLGAVFVGDGPMMEELRSAAERINAGDDVRFVGNQDQSWVASALTSASVVLSPLTGRALVEACLSGTPVVAYDVEWHSELVLNGETGMLVPFGDTEEMAEAVCALLGDPDRAAIMGKRARAAALGMMDPARLIEHERAEYLKVLRGSRGRER